MRRIPVIARRPVAGALPLLVLVLLCSLAVPAQAQWKWRDRDGQVNASDRPPPKDIPDKDILGRPVADLRRLAPAAAAAPTAPAALVPGSAASAAGPLDRELLARKRAAEQEQAAKAKADEERVAAQRAENCRNARGQLAALEGGQRIARTNDKGEREVLDDAGRADELRRTRAVIASDCR
jgi:hypothetical protein